MQTLIANTLCCAFHSTFPHILVTSPRVRHANVVPPRSDVSLTLRHAHMDTTNFHMLPGNATCVYHAYVVPHVLIPSYITSLCPQNNTCCAFHSFTNVTRIRHTCFIHSFFYVTHYVTHISHTLRYTYFSLRPNNVHTPYKHTYTHIHFHTDDKPRTLLEQCLMSLKAGMLCLCMCVCLFVVC